MKIVVGTMEFEIAEPYTVGQVMGEAEAKNLNELRGQRVRGILAKRLAKMVFNTAEEKIIAAQKSIGEIDAAFTLLAPSVAKPKRYTLQDEIYEVAREAALNYGGQMGLQLEGTALESEITRFTADTRVIQEAERRFKARGEITTSFLTLFGSEE